jgi:hypothetical protein
MNPIQTMGQSLDHWQALYIVSIAIAFASTIAIVTFAFHIQQHLHGLKVSNYIYVVASLLAVVSTIVIVNKTKSLDAEKDRQSKAVSDAANVEIEKAKAAAKIADQKAEEARNKADLVEQENIKLRGTVSFDATTARTAEAALAKANKETSDFAHSLQQQQATMAEQAKVSPALTQYQILQMTSGLMMYSGQEVVVHLTSDTVVIRLGNGIETAMRNAGIKVTGSIDMGALYQGVSVAVNNAVNVPPLANALVNLLHQAGIEVHPVAVPTMVQAGQVAIFLGPN